MRLLQEGIKSKERVRKFGEVFTPEWLTRDMCDLCEPDIGDPQKTVLEPACGNGNFLVEILRRRLERCRDGKDILTAIGNMYGVELLEDNVMECRQRLLRLVPDGLRNEAKEMLQRNIVRGDFLNPGSIWFLQDLADQDAGRLGGK